MTNLMKSLAVMIVALFSTSDGADAHEFSELKMDSFSKNINRPYFEILLADTVKGREVVCALFDSAGRVLASDTQYTDNLATKVIIIFEGNDVATARCVFND